MIHDAGIAVIYKVDRNETAPPPVKATLVKKAEHQFGDKTVGSTRFFQAAQVGRKLDRLIEIWRDESITTRDVCQIGTDYYLIVQTIQGEDDDGIEVTRLALELTDGAQWEPEREYQAFGNLK